MRYGSDRDGLQGVGRDVLGKLNGMFGLAIWDTEKRKLVVARDPMGIKPIYYATRSGRLYFGSEIRPVLTALGESPSIDPTALNLFLRYRYTPAPRTLYQGISKLAPGEKTGCLERGVPLRKMVSVQAGAV
jgi:asparagine synthase (glutamine-hydrolysing)